MRDPKKQFDGFIEAYLWFEGGSLQLCDLDISDPKTLRLSSLYYTRAWDYLLECFYLPVDMRYSTDKIASFKAQGLDFMVIGEIVANGTEKLNHEENEYFEAGANDAQAFFFGGIGTANTRLAGYFHTNYYAEKGTLKG